MSYKEHKKIINQKIKEYLVILKQNNIDIWRVYLYGSYATNRFTDKSDIDLAIFLNKDTIDGFQEDAQLMKLRRKVDLRIEPHSFARVDFHEPDPFIKEIIVKGKRVV